MAVAKGGISLEYHTTRSNNRALSHRNSFHNEAATTNPGISANAYGQYFFWRRYGAF